MKNNSARWQMRPLAIGLLGFLASFTMASPAQTPAPEGQTLQAAVPAPITQPGYSPITATPVKLKPLPASFNVHQFEALAQQLTEGHRVPGMALAIVQGGRILSVNGYGVTDISHPQPVDAHTVFRMASLSKAFASAMTGILVNDGLLRWDSKVTDYMPGFQLNNDEASNRLTVADVLSQRSGLPRNAYDRDVEAGSDYYSLTQKLASAPLRCMPGQCYSYQNVAYSLVGDVLFAASGKFYEQSVERRIFKPLGMNDASMGLAGIEASPRWARPHVRSRNGWVSLSPKPTYYRLAPAAGVNASASDLAQWLLAHTGHRTDVLPAPLLATLHSPLISTPDQIHSGGWRHDRVERADYALGWRVFDYQNHQVVFHAGAVQGYRGQVAIVPELDLGIAMIWNGESNLPSGLMPTILDSAFNLPSHEWLDFNSNIGKHNILAERKRPTRRKATSATRGNASPR